MHKYLILFFSATLFLCGCKGNGTPSGIIKPEVMTGLLLQIHLIDGSLYSSVQMPDSLYKYGHGKYEAALKKFHVDSAQFRKSMNYYANESGKLYAIYDSVDNKLKKLTDSVNVASAKERAITRKADSLKTDSALKSRRKPLTPAQRMDSARNVSARQRISSRMDSIRKLNLKRLHAIPKK
ncbi:protein of unknown function [Mucilaginibacter pineti]|uniref:DUF4296 domain-containing protein n=1 Tax=Mucilaginibacter pineti TaxID=1391627 RepID=A0A1G7F069_9SPHI|nr:DUF4296 domain-containing protein [Mucilaginibacter pineti]SDE69360.1 protein of unknown function [Mucilaginibacter pineti]